MARLQLHSALRGVRRFHASHSRATPVALSSSTLSQIASETVQVPTYDRSVVVSGMVHLGVGGFHRAHQAVYTEKLLGLGSSNDWGICGVGLMAPADAAMRDAMAEQDCLYTVMPKGKDAAGVEVVGSITKYLYSPDSSSAVLDVLASSTTKIISLTVTEKGYCFDEVTHSLNLQHPLIQHDVQHADDPKSAIGYIVRGLQKRMAAGLPGVTVLSCDNMPHNGSVIKTCLEQFAAEACPDLLPWMQQHVSFPNSMVDRITPMTTDADKALLQSEFGVTDQWPITCETFMQWVIEDNFCQGRPAWEDVGAMFVPDVYPYELMKLRLLNGGHSALSYVSYLLGHREVDAAMADPLVMNFLKSYMDEIGQTVPSVPGIDLEEYKSTLQQRFANPFIKDQVQRLAQDGSKKLLQVLMPPLKELIAEGKDVKFAALCTAGWMRYLTAVDESGAPIDILDQMAAELKPMAEKGATDARPFITAAFGPELAASDAYVSAVQKSLSDIQANGTAATMAATK